MILALTFAVLADAVPAAARPLSVNSEIRHSLTGGETVTFTVEVPAQTAAHVIVRQDGIDVGVNLRRTGSEYPVHGLDFRAGRAGDEHVFVPIHDAPQTWDLIIRATPPTAPRGAIAISLDLAPADDRSRAIAAARRMHHEASERSWLGDGPSHEAASAQYAGAYTAALAAGDKAQAAESAYQCAREHDNLGRQIEAIEWQERALSLFRELGFDDRRSRALNRLGDYSRKVGEIGAAEEYFAEALPLARQSNDVVAETDILNNSGLLMLSAGRTEEALDQLQAAIPAAQAIQSANIETALWSNCAEAWSRLGRPDKAVEAQLRSLDAVKRLKLPRRTLRTLHLLAEKYFASGDRKKAEESMLAALSLQEEAQDPVYLAEALTAYGRMLHADGQYERAVEEISRAFSLLRESRNRRSQGVALAAWAQIEIDRGGDDAALEKLDEALELARLVANRPGEADVLYQRARALRNKGRLSDAVAAAASAVDIVETLRGAIVRGEFRASYLSTVQSYYDLHVDLLQQRGMAAAAFEVNERARARTLLESLAETGSKIRKGVDAELLKRERAVQAELNAKDTYRAQLAMNQGEQSSRASAIAKDVERLLTEWRDIQKKIRAASPAYAALKLPEPVTARHVQQRLLDRETTLVSYRLGPARSYAWVVDSSAITAHILPAREHVDPAARRYHELLSAPRSAMRSAERAAHDRKVAIAAQDLANAVWKPIASRVQGKRVLIVADGALQYAPFAGLPSPSGEPLIVAHEFVYLPSASVLDVLRRDSRTIEAGASAAVFADPVFTASDSRVAGRSSSTPAEATRGETWSRLRFSRTEAEAVAAAAGKPATFQALDFSAAKKTLFASDLRRYDILHFATHGSIDAEHPELSRLVLSLVDAKGRRVDGFLRLHEIYNLDVDAALVVLSACRTALGKEVHGEGLIGLTRGFMYAGTSRVVSSLWNVDDRASAQLMSRFYAAMLSRGHSPSAALRQAQLELLRQQRWSAPHYWAAFGIHGEWR